MACAIDPLASYAVADNEFRGQKELLRSRMYTPEQRELRGRVLAEITRRAVMLVNSSGSTESASPSGQIAY